MIPSVGRIVHYKLADGDVAAINFNSPGPKNHVVVGQILPAVIVRVWGETEASACNLQVFLDGSGTYWATSRQQGDDVGRWSVPERV
jgi:hypothetical protein